MPWDRRPSGGPIFTARSVCNHCCARSRVYHQPSGEDGKRVDLFDIFDFLGDTIGCVVAAIIVVVLLVLCAACVFALIATGVFD